MSTRPAPPGVSRWAFRLDGVRAPAAEEGDAFEEGRYSNVNDTYISLPSR